MPRGRALRARLHLSRLAMPTHLTCRIAPPEAPTVLGDAGFRWVTLLLTLMLHGAPAAFAQPAIVTDRPGSSNGAFVLSPGTVQLETGAEVAADGPARNVRLGQVVIRWGVPHLELQALVNSFVVRRVHGDSATGFEDLGLGAKLPLYEADGGALRVAALASLSLPSGAAFLTSDEALGAASLLIDRALWNRWSLSLNIGYADAPDAEPGVMSAILTPSVSLPGPGNLSAYVGYAGFYASGADRHLIETGLTTTVTPDLQLDLNAGVETGSGNHYIGVGVAHRWGWP